MNDKPLVFSGKAQKRPLELLKALIALGARDVPESRLIEALWPEAEGDRAKLSLNPAEALSAYRRCERMLASHLGLRPTDQTFALVKEMGQDPEN